MKKYLSVVLLLLLTGTTFGQTVTQTYTDRCTGETFVFSVPSNGQTVVIFYNRSRVFTANDFNNGVLRGWLEETYAWWRNLSPCSASQSTVTIAQQTAQQAASAATQTSTNLPPPPPPSSNSESSPNNSSDSSSPQEKNKEKIKKESNSTKENNSESESESSNNEENSSEEEEEKKDEKKKLTSPPIVVANIAGIQGLNGEFSTALSLGISKSSLLGDESYGINSMVWFNLKQFLVVGNYSKIHIVDNKVDVISSTAVSVAKMYSTYLFSIGHSKTFQGKDGSVFGFNFATNLMSIESSPIKREFSGSFNSVLFFTKPFNFTRLSLSPLLALASNLISYNFTTKTIDVPQHILLIGNNFNYAITQRFVANLGIMTTSSLSNKFPTTYALTIGSRLQF
jgi:hypothetical protein